MIKRSVLLILSLLLLAPSAFSAQYSLDVPHSQIHFSIAHLMVFKVRGNFTDFSGTVDIDTANKTLVSANASIEVSSIDTRNKKRDDHLRSADFFDTAEHGKITFVSKKVVGSNDDITVIGDLTIKGITKEITLNGRFVGATVGPWGKKRAGFTAVGEIDRRDFGLTWNKALETGGVVVGDKVEIGLEVETIAN